LVGDPGQIIGMVVLVWLYGRGIGQAIGWRCFR
jgi:hypothetical protein